LLLRSAKTRRSGLLKYQRACPIRGRDRKARTCCRSDQSYALSKDCRGCPEASNAAGPGSLRTATSQLRQVIPTEQGAAFGRPCFWTSSTVSTSRMSPAIRRGKSKTPNEYGLQGRPCGRQELLYRRSYGVIRTIGMTASRCRMPCASGKKSLTDRQAASQQIAATTSLKTRYPSR